MEFQRRRGWKKVIETNVILFIIYYGDNIVEPKTRKLIPNPASPEMPMMEILMATAYNKQVCSSLRSPKPLRASYTRKALHEIGGKVFEIVRMNVGEKDGYKKNSH